MLNSPHSFASHHGMTTTTPTARSTLPEVTRSTGYSNCVQARVMAAPAFGGEKMYQVKLSCRGQSSSMYKSKEDFRNVINMLKLVGAMARSRGPSTACQVCRDCSVMTKVRCVDEENLNEFLASLLSKLRSYPKQSIDECSSHRGVINVLKEFLSVRNGKFFCETLAAASSTENPEDDVTTTVNSSSSSSSQVDKQPLSQEQEEDNEEAFANGRRRNSHEFCSLHRTLSQKFAAFDSVC